MLDCRAEVTIVAEELEDQVLEVAAETRAVDLLEVSVVLVLEQEVVEVFFLASLLEWEDALHDNEQNDSDAEHVNILALVRFAFLDLWGHVGHGAAVRAELVDVLVTGEAKVSKFQVEIVVNEDVFELEVTVDDPAAVHIVDRVQHLVEEEPSSILAHGTHSLAEVEKETALNELHNNVDEVVNDATARLDDLTGVAILVHVDYACVLEILENGDFVVDRQN